MSEFDFSIGDMPTESGDAQNFMAKVDRYKILELLGRGGFGAVFLAQDEISQQLVAVKTLPSELNQSPEELEAIRSNFQIISNLHHPNIAAAKHLHKVDNVEVFTAGVHIESGEYLLVMEYVAGSTLAHWKRQFTNNKVPVDKALEICRQVAIALDFAHSCKVIHRDIKPGNIMLDNEGHVKILDFGLAAEIRSSMSRVSMEKSSTSGTRPYMAPEQLTGKAQDERSDQYSLSVLFYELVSGSVPFKSVFETGDVLLMMEVVGKNAPDALEEISGLQNKALLKGLAKLKNDRFDNCSDLLACLSGTKKIKTKSGGKGLLLVGASALIIAGGAYFFTSNPAPSGNEETTPLEVVQKNLEPVEEVIIEEKEDPQIAAEKARKKLEKERIVSLYAQANIHLENGNLAQARKVWVEIQQLDPGASKAQNLLKEHAGKMKLRDVIPLKSKAELLLENNLKNIEKTGSYGKECHDLNVLFLSGKAFYDTQNFDDAFDCLTQFNNRVKALESLIRDKATYQKSHINLSNQETSFLEKYPEARRLPIWTELQAIKAGAENLALKNKYSLANEQLENAVKKFDSAAKEIDNLRQIKASLNRLQKQFFTERNSFSRDIENSDAIAYAPDLMELIKITETKMVSAAANLDPKAYSNHFDNYRQLITQVRAKTKLNKKNKHYQEFFAEANSHHSKTDYKKALASIEKALSFRNTTEARDLQQSIEDRLKPKLKLNLPAPGANLYINGKKIAVEGSIAEVELTPSANYQVRVSAENYEDFNYQFKANFNGAKSLTATQPKVDLFKKVFSFFKGDLYMRPIRTNSGGFWMARYEVTQALYSRIMGYNPSYNPGRTTPVTNVSWDDANNFCYKLNKILEKNLPYGLKFRLPTEREWQAACLADKQGDYGFNYLSASNSCFKSTKSRRYQSPIQAGSLAPNSLGLYDMHGNVWEWVDGGSSENRIRKGGSYTSTTENCKASKSSQLSGSFKLKNTGFRVILSK